MRSSERSFAIVAACIALALAFPTAQTNAATSTWSGGSGNWSSNGNPGWNGTGIPMSAGDIIQKIDGLTSPTITVDIPGVTVGTITLGIPYNNALGITPTNPLTLDQDGAGPGVATISNTSSFAGSAPYVTFNAGTINLADDLLISNTSPSIRVDGAIRFQDGAVLASAAPVNVTLESIGNAFPTTTSFVGAIRFQGDHTFNGTMLLKKGLVAFATNNPFGASTNVVTLGQSGQGSVSAISYSVGSTISNPMVVAAGTGGTTLLGNNNSALTSLMSFTGPITLNGDLTTTSASTSSTLSLTLSGNISGAGGITHAPNAGGTGWVTLSGANSYQGKTSIKSGTMRVNSLNSVVGGTATSNLGAPTTVANGTIDIGSSTFAGTLLYQGAGETTDRVINLAGSTGGAVFTNNGTGPVVFTSNFTATGDGNKTLTLSGSNTGLNTIAGSIVDSANGNTAFTKSGAGKWVLSGTNTYSGNTTVSTSGSTLNIQNGQAIPDGPGKGDVSIGTGASIILDSNHSETINGLSSTGTFTTSANVTSPQTLTLGSHRDGATFTFSGAINNAPGTTLGIVKKGLSTQVLSGTTSTYTGGAVVNEGVLRFATLAAVTGSGENVTANFGGTAALGTAMEQAFLDRIVDSSAGVVGMSADSANNLDFSAAGLSATSLGATGSFTYSGTLTPHGTTYRLGGGGSTGRLTFASPLTGASNSLVVGGGGNAVGNKVILTATNTYGGTTTVAGGTLVLPTRLSFYNDTPANWTQDNLIVEAGGTAAFNVGGAGEFTLPEFLGFMDFGTASTGFKNGSAIGIDTTNAGGDVTISTIIDNTNGGANSLGFTKLGTNNVILTGANTYSGKTSIEDGALIVTSINKVVGGNASSSLGAPTTVASGTIDLGNLTTTGSLIYSGAGETTDRVINLAGTTGGGLIDSSGSGPLVFTSNLTGTGNGTKTFTLTGSSSGTNKFAGSIGNDNGVVNFAKLGTSTWELSGANTYTGTTTVDGGKLIVSGSHEAGNTNYSVAFTAGTTADIEFNNATVNSNGGLMVGEAGTGTATLINSTLSFRRDNAGSGQFIGVGRLAGSNGTYTQSGGSVTLGNDWFVTGVDGIGTSTLTNNGVINAAVLTLSQNAGSQGTFTMESGAINTTANIFLTYAGAGNATMTQNGGTITSGSWMSIARSGTASYFMNGGSLKVLGGDLNVGDLSGSSGTYVQTGGAVEVGSFGLGGATFIVGWNGGSTGNVTLNGGTISTVNGLWVGYQGAGTMTQNGGAISVNTDGTTSNSHFAVAQAAGSLGTFVMNHGSIEVKNDWFVVGVGGTGTATILNDSKITAGTFAAGQNGGSTGTIDVNITDPAGFIKVVNTLTNDPISGIARIGGAGTGTLNLMAGSISTGDQFVVGEGNGGFGTLNMTGGSISVGDNMRIGQAGGATGAVNISAGTITVVGNEPNYTGNIEVGRSGVGSLTITGGQIDMIVEATPTAAYPLGTNNSASFSLANYTSVDPPSTNPMVLAQDGNIYIGQITGNGTYTQSAGTMNVAANIFVGGFDTTSLAPGNGSLTLSGGTLRVGTSSPTGGDLVIGSPVASVSSVSLKGGLLDVTKTDITGNYGGIIGSGGAASSKSFSFTGGTLKVRVWNPTSLVDAGPGLGALVQNNTDAASMLDVTGNNTTIFGGYDLVGGKVAVGRQLTVNGDANIGSGGEFLWQLGALSVLNPGADFGVMTVSGNLILDAAAKLTLDFSLLGLSGPDSGNSFWASNRSWKIVDTIGDNAAAAFALLTNPTFASGSFSTSLVGGDIFLNFTSSVTSLPGDFDGDGDVDGADFVAWQTNFPGTYNGGDFANWQTNFPTPSPGGNSPVPEPSTWLLGTLAAVGLVTLRRSRRK